MYLMRQRADARQVRHQHGDGLSETDLGVKNKQIASTEEVGVTLKPSAVRRDFFGRVIDVAQAMARGVSSQSEGCQDSKVDERENVWVSYHEGFSNAVRKPITLDELMAGF